MFGYITRRILGALLVMIAVSTLVFFMLRLVPGDPIAAMLADAGSDEAREALTKKFGFDQPVLFSILNGYGTFCRETLGPPSMVLIRK